MLECLLVGNWILGSTYDSVYKIRIYYRLLRFNVLAQEYGLLLRASLLGFETRPTKFSHDVRL